MTLKSYPAYRTARTTWLDAVPEHWAVGSLRWVSQRFSGGTPDRANPEFWIDGSIPWINSGAVGDALIHKPSAYITDIAYANSSAKWVPAGALVMALAGQGKTKGSVAQLAITTTCNQSMAAIIPNSQISARYLYWWLDSNYANIRGLSGGDLRDGLNLQLLGEIPVPLPPLAEQRSIGRFLDRETVQIDELIAKQERLIELLAEKRQAIITHAITKGLDPSAPTKPSGVPWLGDIPAHWVVRKFNHAADIKGGQVDPRIEPWASTLLIAPNHVESGTGRILYRQTASEQGADSGKYRVRKGEVIYSKIRPYLRKVVTAPSDCLCSADMYAITGRPGQLSNRYLQELMLSQPFTDFTADSSARVAMPKINRESLAQGFLWYPPMAEQEEVLNYIDRESNATNQMEQKASDFIRLLKERRSALISAAVTGKIDVREGAE